LPKASTGWQIRVVRDTDDSTSQMLQNKTQVQAITEVIDARLRYPHGSAVCIVQRKVIQQHPEDFL
jgi:predicted phage tail protein